MSIKKIKMSKIDINHKFPNYEIALKHAKKLKSFIEYMCKNNNYKCEAMIGVSRINSHVIDNDNYYYEKTGNIGKPKIVRDFNVDDETNIYIDYHLHVLIVSYPGETIRQKIKSYINKNWWSIPKLFDSGIDKDYLEKLIKEKKLRKEHDNIEKIKEIKKNNNTDRKVYGNDCDIRYAEYIYKQSETILFIDVDYSDYVETFPDNNDLITDLIGRRYGCSLKNLYYEKLRLNTLYHNNYFSGAEKNKEEKYYNQLIDYYKQFCKDYTEKWLKDFIKNKYN